LWHALLCGALILVTKFFISFVVSMPDSWETFAKQTVIALIATVAIPAILMALMLTTNPRDALRLNGCRPSFIAAGVLMAICLHPFFAWFSQLVLYVYPPGVGLQQMNEAMGGLIAQSPSLVLLIGVFAITPAVIEELAFRGFILRGAQSIKSPIVAVLLTSLLFGAAHAVIQQSIVTFAIGVLLGIIAVRTNSIFPCIAFHATHNLITALSSQWHQIGFDRLTAWLIETSPEGDFNYRLVPASMMVLVGALLIAWTISVTRPNGQPASKYFSFTGFLREMGIDRLDEADVRAG
jgi:sodium transport system permease protein